MSDKNINLYIVHIKHAGNEFERARAAAQTPPRRVLLLAFQEIVHQKYSHFARSFFLVVIVYVRLRGHQDGRSDATSAMCMTISNGGVVGAKLK